MIDKDGIIRVVKVDENSYRILEFFKNHQSISVAILSTVIATISFSIYLMTYIVQIRVLRKWNIPYEFVEYVNDGKYFYYTIAMLMYIVAMVLFQFFTRNALYEFHCKMGNYKELGLYLKAINSNCFSLDEEKLFKKKSKTAKIVLLKMKMVAIFKILAKLTILSIFFIVFELFPIYMVSFINQTIIIGCICSTVILTIMVNLIIRKTINEKNKNWSANNKENTIDKIISNNEEFLSVKYNRTHNLKETFCDKNLISVFKFSIGIFIVFILSIIVQNDFVQTSTKAFWIYREYENEYAVVFQTTDRLFLKSAKINDTSIIIDLSSQKIIKPDNNKVDYYIFDNVILKREDNLKS